MKLLDNITNFIDYFNMSKSNPIKKYKVNDKTFYKVDFMIQRRKIRKQGFINKQSALDYVNKVERLIFLGEYEQWLESQKSDHITVDVLFSQWEQSKKSVKETTSDHYKRLYRLKVKDYFGHIKINKLNKSHIRGFVFKLKQSELSDNYVSTCVAVLRVLIRFAYDKGYINHLIPVKTKLKRSVNKITITPEQVFELLELPELQRPDMKWLKNYIAIQFYLFARQGEVIGLQREHINLNDETINICQRVYNNKVGTTKNGRTIPDFPIHPNLKPYIIEQLLLSGGSEFLFPPVGHYTGKNRAKAKTINYDVINRNLKRLGKMVGVEDLHSHQLRKCSISYFVNEGVSIKFIEYAARINIGMILKHYTKANKDKFRDTYLDKFNFSKMGS